MRSNDVAGARQPHQPSEWSARTEVALLALALTIMALVGSMMPWGVEPKSFAFGPGVGPPRALHGSHGPGVPAALLAVGVAIAVGAGVRRSPRWCARLGLALSLGGVVYSARFMLKVHSDEHLVVDTGLVVTGAAFALLLPMLAMLAWPAQLPGAPARPYLPRNVRGRGLALLAGVACAYVPAAHSPPLGMGGGRRVDDVWVSYAVGDGRFELAWVRDLSDMKRSSQASRGDSLHVHMESADGGSLDFTWDGQTGVRINEDSYDVGRGRVFYLGGTVSEPHIEQLDIPLRSFRTAAVLRFLQHTSEDEARRIGRHHRIRAARRTSSDDR